MTALRPPTEAWQYALVRPHRWQVLALQAIVRDVLHGGAKGVVSAATGSGKTMVQAELAALLLPTLAPHERIVVTAPSQTLVEQLAGVFSKRCPGRVGMFYEHEKRFDRPIILACHASLVAVSSFCPCVAPPSTPHLRWTVDAKWRRFFPPCPHHPTDTKAAVSGGLALALAKEGLCTKVWIADEAHKSSCKQVLAFVEATRPSRRVGFSATPFRAKDDERLWLFDKEIVRYSPTDALQDGVIVPPDIRSFQGDADGKTLEDVVLSMIHDAQGPGVVNAWDTADAESFASWLCEHRFPAAALHSYLSASEQASRIEQLRQGKLRALVHVDLLAEGRDLPWLRWMCLRRVSQGQGLPRIAPTRLIQEVGRALRVDRGKTSAVIYDPHGLFYVLSLTQEALLGGDWSVDAKDTSGGDGEDDESDKQEEVAKKPNDREPRQKERRPSAPVDFLATWAIRLRSAGLVPWLPRTPKRLTERCSKKTVDEVTQLARNHAKAILALQGEEKESLLSAIRDLVAWRGSQAKGDDALSVLRFLSR